jgi:hypothetical protein
MWHVSEYSTGLSLGVGISGFTMNEVIFKAKKLIEPIPDEVIRDTIKNKEIINK